MKNLKVDISAYDIVSTGVYESCSKDMAFAIMGEYKLDRIDRTIF